MPVIELLTPHDWHTLKKIRLSALRDSPHAFLHRYEDESSFDEAKWREEFIRGDWYVRIARGRPEPVGLVGITREPSAPAQQRFLEYLWVAPECRGRGVAFSMINYVLGLLRNSAVRTVFLWVLDNNDRAMSLYKRVGFVSCNYRQPLEDRPERSEELMQLDLV
jgi:ribosomal protein S18 acetylase RimI-like enzyme